MLDSSEIVQLENDDVVLPDLNSSSEEQSTESEEELTPLENLPKIFKPSLASNETEPSPFDFCATSCIAAGYTYCVDETFTNSTCFETPPEGLYFITPTEDGKNESPS